MFFFFFSFALISLCESAFGELQHFSEHDVLCKFLGLSGSCSKYLRKLKQIPPGATTRMTDTHAQRHAKNFIFFKERVVFFGGGGVAVCMSLATCPSKYCVVFCSYIEAITDCNNVSKKG